MNVDSSTRHLLQRLTASWTPRFALPAEIPMPAIDWIAWREGLRSALCHLLGVAPDERPVAATVVERVACQGYTREKLYLAGAFGSTVPCFLLIPQDVRRPAPGST
jgi:hypothetical protein